MKKLLVCEAFYIKIITDGSKKRNYQSLKGIKTMKPLFFPFTYLREQDAGILLACFNSFSFFSTSYREEFEIDSPDLFNDSRIDPVFMEDDELKPVVETLKEYKNWAMLNDGNPGSLKALFRKTPYFTSDTGVANIRSEIGKRSTGKHDSKKNGPYEENTFFLNALLFLKLAHENDAEKDEIELKFQSVSAEESQLFLNVRGEIEKNISDNVHGAGPNSGGNYDPGILMAGKRLCAWVDILLEKRKKINLKEPLVLVTTSRGIADHIEAAIDNGENLSEIERLAFIENYNVCSDSCNSGAACRDNLSAILKTAMSGNKIMQNDITGIESTDNENFFSVDISFYRLPGTDIKKLFCSLEMQNNAEMKNINNELFEKSCKYIFICFIDIKN